MGINYLKELFETISNKHQRGYITGDEFNSLFRSAELNYLQFLLGHTEQYMPGRPIPRVGLGMSKSINEKLAFLREPNPVTVPSNGQQSKTIIAAIETVFRTSDGKVVDFVQPNRLSARRTSSVISPATNPIYTEYDTYFQFYPETIGGVTFVGINYPPESKWNFTTVSGREAYDSAGSVDPLWKDFDVLKILGRMLKEWGVSVKDVEVMQYAQSVISTGE